VGVFSNQLILERANPSGGRLSRMRRLFCAAGLVIVVTTATAAQQTAAEGSVAGHVTDTTLFPIPGVSVTVSRRDTRREVATGADGEFVINGLRPGVYTVTAMLPGFRTRSQVVQVRAAERQDLDFVLPVGCLDEVHRLQYEFGEEFLRIIEAAAYVRILTAGNPERLVSEQLCGFAQPYVAEILGVVVPLLGDATMFRFYADLADQALMPGDELITFFWQDDSTRAYHEWGDSSRLSFRNGRLVEWKGSDTLGIRNGDAVEQVLEFIRARMAKQQP
jgi:hypothetical protein